MRSTCFSRRWRAPAVFAVALAIMCLGAAAGEEPPSAPLIAHWTFDEAAGNRCADASGHGCDAINEREGAAALRRTPGVDGNALELAGEHAIRTVAWPNATELAAITFSAWVLPADLSGYREIFRKEDGDQRLLFSFQAGGSILSLGLNIGGYVECDATIDPASVLDDGWHHAAAAFDGKNMRVYLDGREIGALERPGTIAVRAGANGYIGSSSGSSEHFQGLLDDLRIAPVALGADAIAQLHARGRDVIRRLGAEMESRLAAIYLPQPTFAETVASLRRRLHETGQSLDRDTGRAIMARLREKFPAECALLSNLTGVRLRDFIAAPDEKPQAELAERFVRLMLEYKPLTEHQKQKLTPAEVERWKGADRIAGDLERLRDAGAEARFSPGWVTVILEAGARVEFRPSQSEPVAPYVVPETPATRTLTPDEARSALTRDWLHQAGGNPAPERIRQEITWALELAGRIERDHAGTVRFGAERKALEECAARAAGLAAPDPELYFRVRDIKRAIAFRNPVIDFTRVLLVDMPFPQGSEWPHQTRHRLGYMAVPGGRLLVLEGLSPAGALTQLMPQPPLHGSFWRPDVSYDARRIVFCFKPHNEKSFHIYEIAADGSGLTQVTDGPYDDLDPIYLPDDTHIIFSTTRAHTYVRCMPPTNAYVLARCDRAGRDLYLISSNNEPDYLPAVMDDGRIVYTRWEYTDKPLWRAQGLWTANPDGTGATTLWGNQSVWPDLLKDARSIPGSRRIMFTGSAHHGWFSGSVGIIDPACGFNFPAGLTKVTADVPWPEVGNGPVDPAESAGYHRSGSYDAYYSPYPLGEKDFLVSANRGGKFVLYLMDVDGNRELVYEGVHHIFHAIPLRARPRPPVIPDAVVWPDAAHRDTPEPGVLFSASVYQGADPALRGKVKYLRVLSIDNKTYTYWYKRPYISTGPVVSMVQSDGIKRVIGTVPVEEDGSVAFEAPVGAALHFQLLDENHRALQTMRSFVGLMPGERRGCLGCHELHAVAPPGNATGRALGKPPAKIAPPPWNDRTVSFDRYVQPMLDTYCGTCHQGTGEARAKLDLTKRPGFLMFDEPYVTLTGSPTWAQPYVRPANPPAGWGIAGMLFVEGYSTLDPQGYRTPEPMTALSYRSPLVRLVASGEHHGVTVDPVSLERLILWVDTMCPYFGEDEIRKIPDPEFQGVDWLAVRPRIANAPVIARPGPLE
jgi:hypothetical protein